MIISKTIDDIVEELMTNKNYSSEYARQSSNLLKSLTKALMPYLTTTATKFDESSEGQKRPNLMNKSLPFMKKGSSFLNGLLNVFNSRETN